MGSLVRRDLFAAEITPDAFGTTVVVAGWVEDIRNLGGIAFIRLRDRSGWLQVTVIKKEDRELFRALTGIPRESVVAVEGEVVANEQARQGFELLARHFRLFSEAATPLPLGVADRVDADLDTRLDNRFLDIRKPEVTAIFQARSALLQGMRDRLLSAGFLEVSTPKIVATATEGGTELFAVRYFDREAYLNQSPQLYKQILMASGLDRVFEIAPAFRAESHDTTRHLNEYLSVDAEIAFATDDDAMDVLADAVVGGIERASTIPGAQSIDPPDRIDRITYDEALDIISGRGIDIPWGEDIDAEGLRSLAEEMPAFYFIVRWPLSTKPFYVQPDGDCGLGFDLMCGHIEIASGARRIHDHDLLVERIAAQGLDPEAFGFYLKAFRYGMPPHAGWGLGLDRLVQVVTRADNIRECVLFPRDMKRLVP